MVRLIACKKTTHSYDAVGFTLVEVLLTIALMSIIAFMTIPVMQSFQVKNDFHIARNSIVQSLRRASLLASASQDDSTWGVFVQTGQVIVFKGASFGARDTAYDEVVLLSSSITYSGLTEIVFQKVNGYPLTTGAFTLTSTNGDSGSITLNSKGMILY
jgi:prepilin-type N-terminal cleavage/methylation domain-containing protein